MNYNGIELDDFAIGEMMDFAPWQDEVNRGICITIHNLKQQEKTPERDRLIKDLLELSNDYELSKRKVIRGRVSSPKYECKRCGHLSFDAWREHQVFGCPVEEY